MQYVTDLYSFKSFLETDRTGERVDTEIASCMPLYLTTSK